MRSVRCPECAQLAEQRAAELQQRKAHRTTQQNKLGALATSKKGCTKLASLQAGPHFVVSAKWVNEWRAFLKDINVESVSPVSNGDLICPHNLLCVDLDSELVRRVESDVPIIYVIPESDWDKLVQWNGHEPPTISLEVLDQDGRKSYVCNLQTCEACTTDAAKKRSEALRVFENAELVIRLASSAPSAGPVLSSHYPKQKRLTRAAKQAMEPQEFRVSASSSTLVEQLKLLIYQAREDIEPRQMALSYNGNPLSEPQAPLQVFDIPAGGIIELRIRNK